MTVSLEAVRKAKVSSKTCRTRLMTADGSCGMSSASSPLLRCKTRLQSRLQSSLWVTFLHRSLKVTCLLLYQKKSSLILKSQICHLNTKIKSSRLTTATLTQSESFVCAREKPQVVYTCSSTLCDRKSTVQVRTWSGMSNAQSLRLSICKRYNR